MTEIINKFAAVLNDARDRRALPESTWWEAWREARRQGFDRIVRRELNLSNNHRSQSRRALRQEWGMA